MGHKLKATNEQTRKKKQTKTHRHTDNSMVVKRGKGVGRSRRGQRELKYTETVMEDDLTLGGGHSKQCIDHIS